MSYPKESTTAETFTDTVATDDDKVHETVPVSPPGQVYGTERGQHRFVLELPHSPADRGMDDTPSPVLMHGERTPTVRLLIKCFHACYVID